MNGVAKAKDEVLSDADGVHLQKTKPNNERKLVAETDVYLTDIMPDEDAELVLLQYPLRPPDRLYPASEVKRVRVKPENRRIEMDMDQMTVISSNISLQTKYMIGKWKGDELILAPLDRAVQIRPKMSHLDSNLIESEDKNIENASESKKGDAGVGMELFTVQIQRHETRRQLEAKQQSHAYLREKEESEPWCEVSVSSIESNRCNAIRAKWDSVPSEDKSIHQPQDSNCQTAKSQDATLEYLRKLVPYPNNGDQIELVEASNSMNISCENGPQNSLKNGLDRERKTTLKIILEELFEAQSVCSLDTIGEKCKSYFEESEDMSKHSDITALNEEQLHQEVRLALLCNCSPDHSTALHTGVTFWGCSVHVRVVFCKKYRNARNGQFSRNCIEAF